LKQITQQRSFGCVASLTKGDQMTVRSRAPIALVIGLLMSFGTAQAQQQAKPRRASDASLLAAREAVWRHFFANADSLAADLTDDFIAMGDESPEPSNKRQTVNASRGTIAAGVSLASLAFPRNTIQRYGDVAIIYGQYRYQTVRNGVQGPMRSGRCTEVFRWNGRRWVHTAWHLENMP
jgi:ketosteroid isomerase-like protein